MAEINTASAERPIAGIRRNKKLSTKVDLTPMVDLGFLLITFFIFSTQLSEPSCLKLNMPDDTVPAPPMNVSESTSFTAILLGKNKVFYYEGSLGEALKYNRYGVTSFAMDNGIGQMIRNKQKALEKIGKKNDLTLMFKPTMNSDFGNVVNILDEVKINDLHHYFIMDITEEEKALIAEKAPAL